MAFGFFEFLLAVVACGTYSLCCLASLIFAFSLETYRKIDERLNLELFSAEILNPLSRKHAGFEAWLTQFHKISGLILAFISLAEIKFWFSAISHPAF